ncbi:MAG: sialidase family protein [Lentisphaerota bacterium]
MDEYELKYCREQLNRIFEPKIIGVPAADASGFFMKLLDGELRNYGTVSCEDGVERGIFLRSRDFGLSWQEYPILEKFAWGSSFVQSPWSGDWLTTMWVRSGTPACNELPAQDGVYIGRSADINGSFTFSKLCEPGECIPPWRMLALRTRKRWILPGYASLTKMWRPLAPVVFCSDDDGHTWQRSVLEKVGNHNTLWPHEGTRWQHQGIEPTVVELSDGRLWMLIRTSHDNHYESFSEDSGETWSVPQPSRFYGTCTMSTLFRMSDGRIMLFWNNTTPLPEVDHELQPWLPESGRTGEGEDVFTNRDAFHAAISEDDGKTWIGFRELLLNERRNDHDYRSSGGLEHGDKSVHQSTAIELPEGKILVAVGQHSRCRRFLIFDPKWLYETTRRDNFRCGLGGWSTFQYVKSVAGPARGDLSGGHCAYNRRPGAGLVPDPDGRSREPDGQPSEVLQIARHPDIRLLHEKEGAVWNFPAGKSGELRMRVRLPRGSQGAQICLVDRWFNPGDPVVKHFAQYAVDIRIIGRAGRDCIAGEEVWRDIRISWSDSNRLDANLGVDNNVATLTLKLIRPSINGISYVHIQSLADTTDSAGILLGEIQADVST